MPKDEKIQGYLPKFYRVEVGPAITRPGIWDDKGDEAFLDMLIHAMPPGSDLMLADLVSLPHIWGQTLAFTVAWRDVDHPMHKTVRGEWRGLLALIGLAGWEDWPVSVVEVNLARLAERPFRTSSDPVSADPGGEVRPNFPKVVQKSLPDNAAIGAPEWKNSAVVLYDRNSVSRPERSSDARPVAFCAPRSLIVPARNYAHVLDPRIPWQSDGKGGYPLRDPLNCDGRCTLSRIQLEVLWLYLDKVRGQVIDEASRRAESESPHVGFLVSMLNRYMGDIEEKREQQSVKAPSAAELLGRWDNERFRGFSGPYFDVLSSIPGRPIERVPMETRIDLPGNTEQRFKGVVLYGRTLLRDPGLTPRDVLVWGAHTLEDLGDEPMHFSSSYLGDSIIPPGRRGVLKAQQRARERVQEEAQTAGYLLLHVDELFYPDILCMEKLPDGHDPAWERWLPPLRPLALALFSAEYLRQNLTIENIGSEVRVTLRLDELRSRIGVGLNNRLEKTYTKSNLRVEPPAVLAVWPDFESQEWHHYGVFHLRDSDRELNVLPLPATDDWLPAFIEYWYNEKPIQEFFDCLLTNPDFINSGSGSEKGRQYRGHWFHRRPTVLVCTANGAVPCRKGLILLPAAEQVEANRSGAVVGLDIGSTNTSAAWFLPGVNHDKAGDRQIELEPMLHFLFTPTDVHKKRMEEMFGFPASPKHTPFLSLLKERKHGRGRGPGLPAVHYRIPWLLLETLDFKSIVEDRRLGETYICDLKWAQRNDSTELYFESIEQYLTLLMRLIGAGIVKHKLALRTALWRFSYPDTFTTAEVNSFREIIDRLIRQLNEPGRIFNRDSRPPPTASSARKECDSVCNFFMTQYGNVAQSNTVIVFDVGGRNTDVAIWHQNKIKWNATLAVASRNTMVDFLMRNNDILNPIFPDLWDHYRNLVISAADPEDVFPRMLTELLIQDPRFQDWQVRAREPQRDAGQVARLRNMATYALAGLLYYTAIAFVETLNSDQTDAPLPDPSRDIMSVQLCFGGKGSILFSKFVDRGLSDRLIQWFYSWILIFLKRKRTGESNGENTSGITYPPEIPDTKWIYPPLIFNDNSKREVSEGLLRDQLPNHSNSTKEKTQDDTPSTERVDRKPLYLGEEIYRLKSANTQNSGIDCNNYESKDAKNDKSEDKRSYREYLEGKDCLGTSLWEIHNLNQFVEFVSNFQKQFQIGLGHEGKHIAPNDIMMDILGSTRREFDRECRMAAKDYQRYFRNGDGRTYQPQPVFILALRAALELFNKKP